ncbi:MAG TPA: hypothetical protein VGO36_05065 [Solirubrobacterales bacterium]|jgi:hypothetical protein|nr:hypothetical protein [Solirubrobacterales bacterium]
MAVAAPARKTAPAPAPSRTSPPARKAPARKTPRHSPRAKAASAGAAAPARRAPARRSPSNRAVARPAPPRKAPSRAPSRSKAKRSVGGQLIPLAGRTAVAVGQLPDSGLVMRMTRGRAWIAVLGVLLVGIVTLNVITLSFAASSGKIDEQITSLDQENSILRGRDARLTSVGPVRTAASSLGLAMPSSEDVRVIAPGPDDIATAAQRLAAADPG